MVPKRKNNDESTARERKKQKLVVARTIEVQQSSTLTSAPDNTVAGPSKAVAFADSECHLVCLLSISMLDRAGMRALPSAIDVEKFAEVHTYPLFPPRV